MNTIHTTIYVDDMSGVEGGIPDIDKFDELLRLEVTKRLGDNYTVNIDYVYNTTGVTPSDWVERDNDNNEDDTDLTEEEYYAFREANDAAFQNPAIWG